MKKLQFLFISFVLISLIGKAQVPTYMPTGGLVAWYPFNGNANDESGNGNNGIVNGASLTGDRSGNNDKAYRFNGRSNWINVPYSNSIAVQNELTISVWLYMEGGSCNPRLLEINSISNQCGGYSIYTNGTSNSSRTFNAVLGKCTQEVGGTSINSLTALNWHHLVFTASGLRGISQFYFDGVPQEIMTGALPFFNSINYNSNNLTIGNTNSSRCNWFGGKLDDIAIYNRVLSKNEINQLYTGSNIKLSIENNNQTLCSGSTTSLKAKPLLLDIDGNEYPVVNINNQTWLQKNLNVSRYRNGDVIPQVTDPSQWANLTTGAWCYYNNDSSLGNVYGKLYNWYAVNDTRGLAPFDWNIPSENDVDNLANNLGGYQVAGGKMKEVGIINWNSPNTGADNSSKFTALAGGSRINGSYINKGTRFECWSAEQNNSGVSYFISDSSASIGQSSAMNQNAGLSVRCLLNNATIEPTYIWSTGASTPEITVNPTVTTTYYCTMKIGNKSYLDSVTVNVFKPELFDVDTINVCAASYTLEAASGFSSYLWNNGAENSSLSVSTSGWFSCTVSDGHCFSTDSIFINIVNANITNDFISVCRGTTIELVAEAENTDAILFPNNYQWSTGDTVSIISVIPQQSGLYYLTVGNGNISCTDSAYIRVMEAIPDVPSMITVNAVSTNVCGARTYRYTAPNLPVNSSNTQVLALGWMWSFTGNLGATAVIDSGDINSQVILVRFTSNAASSQLDSVRVCFTSPCGNGKNRSLKLSIGELKVPAAPTGIAITPVTTNVCSGKLYRYRAPSLPINTTSSSTFATATGWEWDFTGILGNDAQIDSGDINAQVILVKFNSNAAAVRGDSVKVRFTSDCGAGNFAAAMLTNVLTKSPAAPASITVTPLITNVCGAKIYRYSAPALVQASGSSLAATGWQWSFRGSLAGNPFVDTTFAVVDSGNINSQIIRVRYKSNDAAITGDSVRVCYLSGCGFSSNKSIKLTNTLLKAPLAPTAITVTAISTNTCGARIYRYSAPLLTASSASSAAATGYVWSFTGTLSGDPFTDTSLSVIDSGNINSRIILVRYKQNRAAASGDSIRVLYTSDCGNSLNRAAKLTNVLLSAPTSPASITTTLVSDVCGARVYRYSAPAISSTSSASGYEWSFKGVLFNNYGTITSGSLNSQTVEVTYSSNAAASATDSIKVRYVSSCGNSSYRGIKLTNTLKVCTPPVTIKSNLRESVQETVSTENFNVNVYPNPSNNYFNLKTTSSDNTQIMLRVFDLQGKMIKATSVNANEISTIGNEFKPGVYILELVQGKVRQTKKIIKL